MASPYRLISTPDTIRLLHVYRNKDSSIAGVLESFTLGSPNCPAFTTLSYVWGTGKYGQTITINAFQVPVLQSVYPILEAICDRDDFRHDLWVWIDSVCINQKDITERNDQVQLMGRIYRECKRTVVWLGNGTRDTDQAMEFLHTLSNHENRLRKLAVPSDFRDLPPELRDSRKWKLLEGLLQAPWWRRVWTIQEFILAPLLVLFCGSRSISRRDLRKGIHAMMLCKPGDALLKDEAWRAAWNRRRILQWFQDESYTDKMSLLALMAYTGNCQATDPRDRVYSLLGLTSPLDREMVGQPSYKLDVATVYASFVKSFVEMHNSLDVICLAHIFSRFGMTVESADPTLPTWVPDWRAQVKSFVVPLMVSQSGRPHVGNFRPIQGRQPTRKPSLYSASGDRAPEVKFGKNLKRMTVKGLRLDYIDGLGGVEGLHGEELDINYKHQKRAPLVQSTSAFNTRNIGQPAAGPPDKALSQELSRLVDDFICCVTLDREDRYLRVPVPVSRFRDEFQHLVSLTTKKGGGADPNFQDWFLLNKHLRIRGPSVEELCHATGMYTITKGSSMKQTNTAEDSFLSRLHDTKGPARMARRLVTTRKGYLGMAPRRAQTGDVVAVLYGCSVPVVLRMRDDTAMAFEFVGECYVQRYMTGERLEKEQHETESFVLV
jgi:hypothetical protein